MARLGDVIEQIRGVSYKPEDVYAELTDESVALLRASNIKDGHLDLQDIIYVNKKRVKADQYLKAGDILVCASSGSKDLVGKAAYVGSDLPMAFGAFCKVVRPTIEFPQYLGHFFGSPYYRKKISDASAGANINNIRNEHIDEIKIQLPSIEVQQYVISILNKTNHLIALRKQQLDKLDELVKVRFVEMFGDIIYNNMNWPTFLLSDIANSRLGKMLDAKQQTGQYRFPYLANFNVQWFKFEIDELHKMDFNEADQKELELKDGDLLVCEGGEVGRCAVWHNQVVPCYFQKALHRIRCNSEIIEPNYLSWWFKFHCDYNQFEDIVGSKATIAHLPGAKLKKLEVVVPPIDLQRQFSSFIDQVEKCKLTTRQGLDKLEMMKKALMQKYFG